jgi:hypothetical protein
MTSFSSPYMIKPHNMVVRGLNGRTIRSSSSSSCSTFLGMWKRTNEERNETDPIRRLIRFSDSPVMNAVAHTHTRHKGNTIGTIIGRAKKMSLKKHDIIIFKKFLFVNFVATCKSYWLAHHCIRSSLVIHEWHVFLLLCFHHFSFSSLCTYI